MSYGERDKNVKNILTERKTASDKKCPECGRTAVSRYWNEKIEKWVYKHPTRFMPTVYHFANE